MGESAFISKKPATLHAVSQRAGLSPATVSRALNGHPSVRPETLLRVTQAARELNYVPHQAARALAGGRSTVLTVVFPVVASGFFAEVLDGIDEEAAASGFQVNTLLTRHRADEQNLLKQCLSDGRAAAVMVMNVMLDASVIQTALKQQVPLVVLDRPVKDEHIPAIVVDNYGAAKAAFAHLIEAGCKNITVIAGPKDNYDAQQRLRGCKRVMRSAAAKDVELTVWPGAFSESLALEETRRRLAEGDRPDAIFALNDDMALGARQAILETGLEIPGDVLLVGFDDISATRHLQMTTVRSPMREMGRRACRTAVALSRGQSVSMSPQVLDCELIVRQSTTGARS